MDEARHLHSRTVYIMIQRVYNTLVADVQRPGITSHCPLSRDGLAHIEEENGTLKGENNKKSFERLDLVIR